MTDEHVKLDVDCISVVFGTADKKRIATFNGPFRRFLAFGFHDGGPAILQWDTNTDAAVIQTPASVTK